MKFKSLNGGHQDSLGRNYNAGDIVTTSVNLCEKFPGLFEKIIAPESKGGGKFVDDIPELEEKGLVAYKEGKVYVVSDKETGEDIAAGEGISSKAELKEFLKDIE